MVYREGTMLPAYVLQVWDGVSVAVGPASVVLSKMSLRSNPTFHLLQLGFLPLLCSCCKRPRPTQNFMVRRAYFSGGNMVTETLRATVA